MSLEIGNVATYLTPLPTSYKVGANAQAPAYWMPLGFDSPFVSSDESAFKSGKDEATKDLQPQIRSHSHGVGFCMDLSIYL